MSDYTVHGELFVDGDASVALAALVLYARGSTTVRTLTGTERLYVTDVTIVLETAGDAILVADAETAGKYLVNCGLASGVPLIIHYNTPFICLKATGLKFKGSASNKSMVTIEGFIREA